MNFQSESITRPSRSRAVRNAAVLLLVFTVAACQKSPFKVIESNCPAVSVVSNVGSLTRFAGAGRNADDVTFNATITGVLVDCDEGKDVDMEVTFAIVGRSGPAMTEGSVTLPYFIILMRDNHLITAKKIYETTVNFSDRTGRAAVMERIVMRFDDVTPARRYDYELLIGFQLTPDEVIYNALR